MNLGNIKIAEVNNDSSCAIDKSDEYLGNMCRLLEINDESMSNWLCNKRIKTAQEVVNTQLSLSQVIEGRFSSIKACVSRGLKQKRNVCLYLGLSYSLILLCKRLGAIVLSFSNLNIQSNPFLDYVIPSWDKCTNNKRFMNIKFQIVMDCMAPKYALRSSLCFQNFFQFVLNCFRFLFIVVCLENVISRHKILIRNHKP